MTGLPKTGASRESIFAALEAYRQGDLKWRSGRTFGFVYDPGTEAEAVGKQAYASYLTENGLDPTSFPSLLRLENEVMAMARAQLGAPAGAAGAFTSGGTESIILVVKAARDRARAERPGLVDPEMVLAETAHAAFMKAGHYLGVRPVITAVDPVTFRADPAAMRAAITDKTILVVGSAPSYAHGVVDPIPEIAAAAAERGVLCHVDACVGGWLLPYFRRLGSPIPPYDFSVPGVTSMTMDLHKYAFVPKGASIVMYRNAGLRKHQIYANATWSGYSMVNMAVQSSKTGGPLAGAWAVLNFLGDEGYLEIARRMRDTTLALVAGIDAIPGLHVLGKPDLAVFAFASDDTNPFHIADEMKERGWYVQPQLRRGSSPANLHLTIGPTNQPWVPEFLADLARSVTAARALPDSPLAAQLGAAFAGIDPRSVGDEMIGQMMAIAGGGNGMPARMAEVNQILDALPAALVERILVEFVGKMFS